MSRRGFSVGSKCKVFEIEKKNDTWCKCKISIRHKEDDGTYETDFNRVVDFFGKAASQIMEEGEGAFVRLAEISVTRKYDKEKQKEYFNFSVFRIGDDEDDEPVQKKAEKKAIDDFVRVENIEDDDDIPF